MSGIKFQFNFKDLENYLEGLAREYKTIPDKTLQFTLVNTAKDVGRPNATGLYYYPFVDKGRGEIVRKAQNVGFGVRRHGKLVFRNASTGKWVSTLRVGPSHPRRLTEAVVAALNDLVREEAITLLEKGVPRKRQIEGFMNRMKRRAVTEAKRATMDRIPGGRGKHYRTRQKLYSVDVPGLADSFKIKEIA